MRTQIADSHLTYIGSTEYVWGVTVLDVYPRDGGPQLGWVVRDAGGKTWRATSDDPRSGPFKTAKTRWEAALALWPESAAFKENE